MPPYHSGHILVKSHVTEHGINRLLGHMAKYHPLYLIKGGEKLPVNLSGNGHVPLLGWLKAESYFTDSKAVFIGSVSEGCMKGEYEVMVRRMHGFPHEEFEIIEKRLLH